MPEENNGNNVIEEPLSFKWNGVQLDLILKASSSVLFSTYFPTGSVQINQEML